MSSSDNEWIPGIALLFCPGDRADRFSKAYSTADMVIVDLEDGVGEGRKHLAREAIRSVALDPARTIVRTNPASHEGFAKDRSAVRAAGIKTVMVPKVETPADIEDLAGLQIIALCETPRGVTNAEAIASVPDVVGLMWGAEDLTAALGGTSSRRLDGGYTDVVRHARSHILLAAAAAGKHAIDGVYLMIDDELGLRREADDAARSGFAAKCCVHPRQVQVVRDSFAPSAGEIRWASEVIAASTVEGGVFSHHGKMIDEPLLRQARRIVEIASASSGTGVRGDLVG